MELNIRIPQEEDVQELVANISAADRREIEATGFDVEWAIRHSLRNSIECVAIRNGRGLGCLVGVSEEGVLAPTIYPWMLGTDLVQEYPIVVWKLSKLYIERWRSRYPLMENYVDARNERAVQWLKRLGAEMELLPQYGLAKVPFYKFTFRS